ncbi:MAG: AbrB/MazE/SpoVT family DNA-binding domain-containing protein [Anaerolineales bacterium]
MPTPAVRVQEKGQVTIPVEIRQKLNLKKGDLVTFVETEEGVMIKPAEVIVSEALDEIVRSLKRNTELPVPNLNDPDLSRFQRAVLGCIFVNRLFS